MALALTCVVVASAACGGGKGGSTAGGATVPEETSSPSSSTSAPTTTAAIDITKKPDVVTVAYADAVMDELDRLLSDAIRDFVANDGPTKKFDDLLNAVYDEPSLEHQRSAYGRDAAHDMTLYRHPPGDIETAVQQVLKNDPNCVVLVVKRTFAATLVDPKPRTKDTSYIAFEPTDGDGDPSAANPTPWSIVFDGDVLSGEDPTAAC